MTVTELLEHAKSLTQDERTELAKLLIDMIDTPASNQKTGAEIVAFLESQAPIEFVDDHIEDPVEWVEAQRRKRQDYLQTFADHDSA